VQPADRAFTFHVEELAEWCGVVLQTETLKAIIGADLAIEPVIGLEDPVLSALMEAICAEVLRGGGSGRRFAEAMSAALATQLLRQFGEIHGATAAAGQQAGTSDQGTDRLCTDMQRWDDARARLQHGRRRAVVMNSRPSMNGFAPKKEDDDAYLFAGAVLFVCSDVHQRPRPDRRQRQQHSRLWAQP
jgi:hypothetical protein